MRSFPFAAALVILSACDQSPLGAPPNMPSTKVEQPVAAPVASAAIDGWEIDQTAYAMINTPLPAMTGAKPDGTAFTSEELRGRWTIVGLWSAAPPAEEANYTAALSSAADQDPDLDVLVIHASGTAPQPAPPWPMLEDSGALLSTLAPPTTPAYLLIGPDLTIEGYRSALSEAPDDGIKSVIRGVAEIRKQIAAPQ